VSGCYANPPAAAVLQACHGKRVDRGKGEGTSSFDDRKGGEEREAQGGRRFKRRFTVRSAIQQQRRRKESEGMPLRGRDTKRRRIARLNSESRKKELKL